MPLKVEDVIVRVEIALDWTHSCKPPSFEQRLQDIEAEIARLRGIQQKDRQKVFDSLDNDESVPDGPSLELTRTLADDESDGVFWGIAEEMGEL